MAAAINAVMPSVISRLAPEMLKRYRATNQVSRPRTSAVSQPMWM